MQQADIGLIGLAVMGENLVMNMESKGFTVAVYNRTTEKVEVFLSGRASGKRIIGCHTLTQLRDALTKPRKVMLMVKAGQPVDDYIEQLLTVLDLVAELASGLEVDHGGCVLVVQHQGIELQAQPGRLPHEGLLALLIDHVCQAALGQRFDLLDGHAELARLLDFEPLTAPGPGCPVAVVPPLAFQRDDAIFVHRP